MNTTELVCQRDLFDLPIGLTYLNCATMSPLLKASAGAGNQAIQKKMTPWTLTAADFFTESEYSRGLFAQLLGSTSDDVAIMPSVSYGMTIAANTLPVSAHQSIVVLAEQFPSNVYPWQHRAEQTGATLHTVARPGDDNWTAAILDAIDEKTAVVACAPCHWTDGSRIDLQAVGHRCRAVGAALVVDGTQAFGMDPFDVQTVRPDFAVAATYKWLLGPYSYGYMYVASRWQNASPLEHNWITRKNAEDFSTLVDYTPTYQAGARRFDVGEHSNFLLTPIAISALEHMLDWRADRLATYTGKLNSMMAEALTALGFTVPNASCRVSHLLGARLPENVHPPELLAFLAEQRVYVSVRGRSLRIAPHVYNNADDIQQFIEAMTTFIRMQTT